MSHEQIRSQTADEFQNSVFFKPREKSASVVPVVMAPIIVREIRPDATAPARTERIGSWIPDESDTRRLTATRSTVYLGQSPAMLNGREHRQITYVWWQPRGEAPTRGTRWFAVRMTLDDDGAPHIWELLDGARQAVLFVSQSLERSARQAYGDPLPERRFSVETALDDQPSVIVARVLADGPIAMGPLVYQSRRPAGVKTLLCRCMPSQVAETVDGVWYDIEPLAALAGQRGGGTDLPSSVYELPVPLADMHDPNWLENALRLPPDF